jgi:lipoprotein-anchoring transpeptidase ErfK/SrfK
VLEAVTITLLLAGCAGPSSLSPAPPLRHVAAPTGTPPVVATAPSNAASGVPPSEPVRVTTNSGSLTTITVTGSDGSHIPGTLAPDGRSWTANEPLHYATTYSFSGAAINTAGAAPVTGSFTTARPTSLIRGRFNLGDGQTVGVGAPIILQFNGPVRDKKAVQDALSVHTSVPTQGSWAWLPDTAEGSRIHWRPKTYWAPGTQVVVTANLAEVPFGDGASGAQNLTLQVAIGRSQIVHADARTHRMIVIRDGQQAADYPASYGLDSSTDRTTRSGTHIVMETDRTERMVSQRYHYDVLEQWAVRISNSGEFIHANPASNGAQGNANVTHGCINLSTSDAENYFGTALYGDPVEVTGTGVPLGPSDGDIYDWTIPWEQWQAMSA